MILQDMMGERNIHISYVINNTLKPVLRANVALILIPEPFINLETFDSTMIHFEPSFNKDSKQLWKILKSLLLDIAARVHTSEYENNSNVRKGLVKSDFFMEEKISKNYYVSRHSQS